jgi:pilus assembly protein CpaF
VSLSKRLAAIREPGDGDGPKGPEPAAMAPASAPAPSRAGGDRSAQRAPLTPALVSARSAIHDLLVERHADELDITDRAGIRTVIQQVTDAYVREKRISLTRADYSGLIVSLLDTVLGLGPLEPLLEDPEITEIMINRPGQVFVERNGRTLRTGIAFESDAQLKQVIDRIVSSIGRRVDESSPMCDARLKDGSRVNVILPPLVPRGACLTIRKFSQDKLQGDDLVRMQSATPDIMRYLAAAVRSRLSIVVSGGTSSGKTTLLNILSSYIPADERVITIEDSAELQLYQEHLITMESRPPNVEGQGAISIRDLVRNALRMRPDRLIVGECRGAEALDMLQAMNTGHEGSLSTVHANSPEDAVSRLETMVLMAGTDLPSRAILKQIASAVDIIVQVSRLRGGERKIVGIAEITGLADGEIQLQELFEYRQLAVSADGRSLGYHRATGKVSTRLEHFAANGEALPDAIFVPIPAPQVEELP